MYSYYLKIAFSDQPEMARALDRWLRTGRGMRMPRKGGAEKFGPHLLSLQFDEESSVNLCSVQTSESAFLVVLCTTLEEAERIRAAETREQRIELLQIPEDHIILDLEAENNWLFNLDKPRRGRKRRPRREDEQEDS